MTPRTIKTLVTGRPTMDGDGVPLTRVLPNAGLGRLDPFLMLDHFGPLVLPPGSDAGFPPHPHKGFMTYTYLTQGAFRHRDSRGGQGTLAPGGAQLMIAGRGIVHEEMPVPEHLETGGAIEGFQLWINLAAAHKGAEPGYTDLPADVLVWKSIEGGRIKVLAGSWLGGADPVSVPTPFAYAHLALEAGARFQHAIPAGWNAAVFVLKGSVDIAGKTAGKDQLAVLSDEGEGFALSAKDGAAFLLFMGEPIGEPVAQYGPFVMNTEAELEQAFREFQGGKMGVLE
ncbi:MAG TPA: pirin family protein [Holophagaceae bacterium]|jgi:redox-sensitive bicupin YhaK (pirin superfamily)|nr:pirin family protein [Holophagaceae bacterium]